MADSYDMFICISIGESLVRPTNESSCSGETHHIANPPHTSKNYAKHQAQGNWVNGVGFWRPRSQGFFLEKGDLKALGDEVMVLVLRLMMVEKETSDFKSHTNRNNAIFSYGIMFTRTAYL